MSVALTLLVSRRRNKSAMWVFIALFVLALLLFVPQILTGPRFRSEILGVVGFIGEGVAFGLLFTPSARRWMRREDEKVRNVRDVFD